MQAITLEEAQNHLAEIIAKLAPGEEIVLTHNNRPVARIVGVPVDEPHPVPGRGRGMLTVLSEDDEHLKDFSE
jgi:prevent-host-death family protein